MGVVKQGSPEWQNWMGRSQLSWVEEAKEGSSKKKVKARAAGEEACKAGQGYYREWNWDIIGIAASIWEASNGASLFLGGKRSDTPILGRAQKKERKRISFLAKVHGFRLYWGFLLLLLLLVLFVYCCVHGLEDHSQS